MSYLYHHFDEKDNLVKQCLITNKYHQNIFIIFFETKEYKNALCILSQMNIKIF
jgi:hypothetical protein